jgi:group I intron endonuclease
MKISGIYKIQSLKNSKRCYIGSAINIHRRWMNHLVRLRKNCHENNKLQRHYNKYGKDDLQFSILIGCDKNDLLKSEQFFIDIYKPYFNICLIAGSHLGVKKKPHTEEAKQRMRIANMGKEPWNKGKKGVYSVDTLLIMSKKRSGIKDSEEVRQKKSKALKGNTNGKALKGILKSEEYKQNCKNVWVKRKLDKINMN